ncbi:MAG: type II toxin-antitoxin system Phd/YefM family antitoxin [Actinomycetes bacterium]
MDVPVSELRAHLSDWLAKVRSGDEVVVTERGVPVARLVPLDSTSVLERLTADGVLGRPGGSKRPFSRPRPTNTSGHPLSDVVSEQRDT